MGLMESFGKTKTERVFTILFAISIFLLLISQVLYDSYPYKHCLDVKYSREGYLIGCPENLEDLPYPYQEPFAFVGYFLFIISVIPFFYVKLRKNMRKSKN